MRAWLPHPPRYLIIPGDIDNPMGSRGDQAMFTVILSQIQGAAKPAIVEIAVRNPAKISPILPQGVDAVSFGAISTEGWKRTAALEGYDALFIQGSDVMDGFYDEAFAFQLWDIARAAHSQMDDCSILGISLNAGMAERVRQAILSAPGALNVGVRDPISLERLRSIRPGFGKLVADIAFLLPARPLSLCTPPVKHSLAWCQSRQNAGNIVVGVNIHSMLFWGCDSGRTEQLVATFADAMRTAMAEYKISFLLLPHDFRETIADGLVLERMFRLIQPDFPEHVHLHADASHANEFKTLVGGLDALVTARMHLAIAALGQSVPVAAVPYQDKFEGLFQLFDLPGSLMLAPGQACHTENVLRLFKTLIKERQDLSLKIGESLPGIIALAEDNFRP